jgi:peptidoglycan hydrolase-like protein with peptidoglycan-binding domain
MAATGIARIDALLNGGTGNEIARGVDDPPAVGALQDLLIGHGARQVPGILGAGRGLFGPKTEAAVMAFQLDKGTTPNGKVDKNTLRAIVDEPALEPIAAQSYLTLVLGLPWSGFTRLVALTAQFEAAGKFTARNRNSDGAGLSFGIIQWAQKPGRLNGLLRSFERTQPDLFVNVFGGDAGVARGLLAHTAKPNGGVMKVGGVTTDPAFDLVSEPWNSRFIEAGRDRVWQRVQITEAITAFRESCNVIREVAPIARSERALAFLLDVANQHGNGGLRNICGRIASPAHDEAAFTLAVANESIRRLEVQFGVGSAEARSTRDRRTAFRTSELLSNDPFVDA